MSRQLFKQLFLGERGQALADIQTVTDEQTPYTVYSEQVMPDVKQSVMNANERAHTNVTDIAQRRPSHSVTAVPQDEPSLGF